MMEFGEVEPPADRKGNWMLTVSGKAYWPMDPREEEVDIEDIAHALSMQCRYTGHTIRFYSVAEHSLYVSYLVPQHLALEGLLHDAAEAYVGDLNRPVKIHCEDYKKIEAMNDLAIRAKFKLPAFESKEVKQADTDILLLEKEVVCPPSNDHYKWEWNGSKPSMTMFPLSQPAAKYHFLRRFHQLWREHCFGRKVTP